MGMEMSEQLTEYLQALDPSELNYLEWIQCGMALKQEGYPVTLWDEWSARDTARYKPGECIDKWNTFSGSGNIVTGGTIYQMCRDRGLLPDKTDRALDWNSQFIADGRTDRAVWHPGQEVKRYLETIFTPGDLVCIVTRSMKDKDGKYKPCDKGNTFKVSELIDRLNKYGDDIGAAFGDYNPIAGAWVRFNPVDGQGVRNTNVTKYRYALVESDTLTINEQRSLIRKLNLPIAVLVHSGGKSLHAIVRINAPDYETYKTRVRELYEICKENGLEIDEQKKNPSRLSRLPGCDRNGSRQRIIEVNTGPPSWGAWERSRIGSGNADKNKVPKLNPISAIDLNALDIPEIRWIVKELLPEGVALLSAPPKSYKSFMMLDLCVEVCRGGTFMNHQCNKNHVLYLDLESGKRRPRDRLKKILNGDRPPEGLYILTGEDDVRRIGQGFEDQITDLLNHDAELRLIIIDVLKMIRPEAKRGQLSYDADYELIKPLSEIANSFPGLCIVAVTHDRKMKDVSDWTNNLSGSTGLTGAVDVIMRIDKDKRDSEESTLLITGRDVEPQALQMKFDKNLMRWQFLGTHESIQRQRFSNDFEKSPVVRTIKKGLEMERGTYCATASDMITASVFWGCAIHDTPQKVARDIERFKPMLNREGITFTRSRTGSKRTYAFTRLTTEDLMNGLA